MDVSLFGQTLLVVLCLLSFGSLTVLLLQVHNKYLAEIAGVGLIIALILQIAIAWYYNVADELPSLFILMLIPFTLSLYIPVALYKSRNDKWKAHKTTRKKLKHSRPIYILTFVASLSCLLLSLDLVNGYYRYFPTIGSLTETYNSQAAVIGSGGQVVLQYSAGKSKVSNNQQTLESLIYDNTATSTNGNLYSINIPGTVSKFHPRTGWVYVPAIAAQDDNTLNLPVMVMLAGYPGAPTDWLHGVDLQSTMDNFAKAHHGITPIVFVVDDTGTQFNDTECVNSSRGNVETYLTTDVPNYIKNHFPVSDNPQNWAVGGISMGGMCGAMLALVHPNIYHYFVDIGGNSGPEIGSDQDTIATLFNGSRKNWAAHQPTQLLSSNNYTNMGGFFASGKDDSPDVVLQTRQLYLDSKQAGLSTVYESVPGEHTFNVFSQIFKDALPWISNRIGATNCSGSNICD